DSDLAVQTVLLFLVGQELNDDNRAAKKQTEADDKRFDQAETEQADSQRPGAAHYRQQGAGRNKDGLAEPGDDSDVQSQADDEQQQGNTDFRESLEGFVVANQVQQGRADQDAADDVGQDQGLLEPAHDHGDDGRDD